MNHIPLLNKLNSAVFRLETAASDCSLSEASGQNFSRKSAFGRHNPSSSCQQHVRLTALCEAPLAGALFTPRLRPKPFPQTHWASAPDTLANNAALGAATACGFAAWRNSPRPHCAGCTPLGAAEAAEAYTRLGLLFSHAPLFTCQFPIVSRHFCVFFRPVVHCPPVANPLGFTPHSIETTWPRNLPVVRPSQGPQYCARCVPPFLL
jgi:hypothetical protein